MRRISINLNEQDEEDFYEKDEEDFNKFKFIYLILSLKFIIFYISSASRIKNK